MPINENKRLGGFYGQATRWGVYDTDGTAPTLVAGMGCGGGHTPMLLDIKPIQESKCVGGLSEQMWGKQYHQQNRVYSMGDVSMCLPAQIPEGSYKYLEIKKVHYETVPQTVRVRKYPVDEDALKRCLREHKKYSNKEIAEKLNVPLTMVEHWFRQDQYFSIPTPDIWLQLKALLGIETNAFDQSITEFEEKIGTFEKADRIYIPDGSAPTVLVSDKANIVEIKQMDNTIKLGNVYNPNFTGGSFAGNVYDPKGISPTLNSMQGGGRQPCVTEIKALDEQNMRVREETFGTLTTDGSTPKHNNRVIEITKENKALNDGFISNEIHSKQIKIRQATKEGTVSVNLPACVDLNYVNSKTRRGRAQQCGQICPTLATENPPSVLEEWIWEIDGEKYLIRIRKLTPKECFRLMGFCTQNEDGSWDDSAYEKASSVVSNTQLYKQAGNSICVPVLENIFKQLFQSDNGKEE